MNGSTIVRTSCRGWGTSATGCLERATKSGFRTADAGHAPNQPAKRQTCGIQKLAELRFVRGLVAKLEFCIGHTGFRHQLELAGERGVRDGARVGADGATHSCAHQVWQRVLGELLDRLASPVRGRTHVEDDALASDAP